MALRKAGIETAELDARLLLELATGASRERQLADPERRLSAREAAGLAALLERRRGHEPMAHLIGRREFYGLAFMASPAVLIPRPDTETLVDAALRRLQAARPSRQASGWRLLDLGTGSGCILLTLLAKQPNSVGIGTDISAVALAVARTNAGTLAVAERCLLVQTSWADSLDGGFDLVLSNPPYIETAGIASLDSEVRDFEPRLALDGGADGLTAYRAIAAELPRLLAPGGAAFFEVGQGQAALVAGLCCHRGYRVSVHRDLAGIPRVLEMDLAAPTVLRADKQS